MPQFQDAIRRETMKIKILVASLMIASSVVVLPAAVASIDFPIAAPHVLPASGTRSGLSMASSGHGFLAVWTDFRSGSGVGRLTVGRVDESGRFIDQGGIALDTISPRGVAVASDGTDYLVAYSYLDSIAFRRISATGEVGSRTLLNVFSDSLALAWNGSRYLLAFTPNTNMGSLRSVALDRNGTPLGTPKEFTSSGGDLRGIRLASTGGAFQAVWRDDMNRQIHTQTIAVSSSATALSYPAASTAVAEGSNPPSIAAGGPGYLIAWREKNSFVSPARDEIWVRTVTPSGTLPGDITIFRNVVPASDPVVTWNGSTFVVVFRTTAAQLVAVRVGTGAEQLDAAPIPLATSPAIVSEFAAASSQQTTFVAWIDQRFDVSVLTRHDQIFGVVMNNGLTAQPPVASDGALSVAPAVQTAAAVTAEGSDYLALWVERGERDRIFFKRIRPSADDQPGLPISDSALSQQDPAAASSGSESFAVWTESDFAASAVFGDQTIYRGSVMGAILGPESATPRRRLVISANARSGSRPAVTWNGTFYLVAWTEGIPGRVMVQRFDRNGDAVGASLPIGAPSVGREGSVNPVMRSAGGTTAIAWFQETAVAPPVSDPPQSVEGYDLHVLLLASSLVPVSAEIALGSFSAAIPPVVSLAASSDRFLIAWKDWSGASSTTPSLAFAQLSLDGSLRKFHGPSLVFGEADPSTMFAAGAFWIAGGEGELWRVDEGGSLVAVPGMLPAGPGQIWLASGGWTPLALSGDGERLSGGFLPLNPRHRAVHR